jgi:hypothetical protein
MHFTLFYDACIAQRHVLDNLQTRMSTPSDPIQITIKIESTQAEAGSTLKGTIFTALKTTSAKKMCLILRGVELTALTKHGETPTHHKDSNPFLSHEYALEEMDFEISLPKELPSSLKPLHGSHWPQSTDTGQCELVYSLQARQGEFVSEKVRLWIDGTKRTADSTLSVHVGCAVQMKNSILCGMFTMATTDSFPLSTAVSSLTLALGERFRVIISDDEGALSQKAKQVVVRITQTIKCSALIKPSFWEKPSFETLQIGQEQYEMVVDKSGLAQFNSKAGPLLSYSGKLIEISHVLVVFANGGESNVIASIAPMPVAIVRGEYQ